MIAEIKSGMLTGIQGKIVTVQSDISEGLPIFQMIGNLSSEVKEAKERVRTALKNSDYFLPVKRISVNLAPGDFKKNGVTFDLAIALSLLVAIGVIPESDWKDTIVLGELSLDGRLLPVHGVLPILHEAVNHQIRRCFIPKDNIREAEFLEEMEVYGFEKLSDVISYLQGHEEAAWYENEEIEEDTTVHFLDFCEIKGQEMAKRAAVIAAAGFHNLLLEGAPGAGKSMLAAALPGILPLLTTKEEMEVAMLYSAGRAFDKRGQERKLRPYRAPEIRITPARLIGGGRNQMPGEITLAHRGILFLDELMERKSQTLELLRGPLETHDITLHSEEESTVFPADFMLVGACNPCPCGYYPDRTRCRCNEMHIRKYQASLSGPMRDRIDLFVCLDPPSYDSLTSGGKEKSSEEIRKQVEEAWEIQGKRQGELRNSRLSVEQTERYCKLDEAGNEFIKKAYSNFGLTGRSYYKVLRVARTISDLRGSEKIEVIDLQEALQYRVRLS